ncbi:hypothetical protein KM043_016286 [Ampulex compressa]|nr:hypothetical protein KM043_016286 [Ampulex compressa]
MTETYLPTPVLLPFSKKSCGILRSPSTSGTEKEPEDREILSRVLPDECCWLAAQSGRTFCAMHRIPEGIIALSNFVHHNEYFHRGVPISCSTEFRTILARHRCNHDEMVMKQCGEQFETIVSNKTENQLDNLVEDEAVDKYHDRVINVLDKNGKDSPTTLNEEQCDTLIQSNMFLEEKETAIKE